MHEYGKKQSRHEKNEVTTAYHIKSKYNNNEHYMVIFHKKWKNYNETQLKKKMDLNIRKMTNHPPSQM